MVHRFLLIALMFVGFFTACEKVEIPEASIEGIPFSLEGEIDGEKVFIGIQKEGHVMRTNAEYRGFESDSIWEFSGYLGPEFPNEGPSFYLAFRPEFEGRALPLPANQILEKSHWNPYNSAGKKITRYPLEIEVGSNDTLEVLKTYVKNHHLQQTAGSLLEIELNRKEAITACVEYQTPQMKKGEFCSEISENQSGWIPTANWVVEAHLNEKVTLRARMSHPNSDYLYKWDDHFSENAEYTVRSPGTYELKAMDSRGRLFSHKKELVLDENSGSYLTYANHIYLSAQWQPERNSLDFVQAGTFRFEYTDAKGVSWILSPQQEEGATLEILEQKMYLSNHLNQPTRALLIELNCTLQNEMEAEVVVRNLRGWVAVGLPD